MPKEMYIGVNGQAKSVSDMYIGVNGQAKKVTKAYIGVNGQAKLFYEKEKFWKNVSLSGNTNNSQGYKVGFNKDANLAVFTKLSSPYVEFYKKQSDDAFIKITSPTLSALDSNSGQRFITDDGVYTCLCPNAAPYTPILLKRIGDTIVNLGNIPTPTDSQNTTSRHSIITGDGKYIFQLSAKSADTTYSLFRIWRQNGIDSYEFLMNIGLTANYGSNHTMASSGDGKYVICGHGLSPFITAWVKIDGQDLWANRAIPSLEDVGNISIQNVAISRNGEWIIIISSSNTITIWNNNINGTISAYQTISVPGTNPYFHSCDINDDGSSFVVAGRTVGGIQVYSRINDQFVLQPFPAPVTSSGFNGVSFGKNDQYVGMTVAQSNPGIYIYKSSYL